MDNQNRFHWDTRPNAQKENLVVGQKYRFTILTPQLVRMEYSPNGVFEDRPSQSVFYRDFSKVSFQVMRDSGRLHIETDNLKIVYEEEKEFDEKTLSISLKTEPASTWHFGEDFEDLGGTYQTLDNVNGEVPLERGVCSRYGFSVLDDSETLVLGEDDWVAVRQPNTKDVYFFGYGYDYLGAVKALYGLTGKPVMLPAYALGNWWSRFYSYTQEEYLALMDKFQEEDIPFTVAIIDMDWHITDVPKELQHEKLFSGAPGWTGYSWDKKLFPDYKGFLKDLEKRNLKTALNLHPADGCCQHEDMYEELCKASGMNPKDKQIVPFNILSQKAMEDYFDIILHPYEEAGVNFWWMDWQQGTSYGWIHEPNTDGHRQDEREILDPLWMLNHLHILDISKNGKRPMYFSRYSGPGSHRYSIGFSGDTHVTWESLAFQPYFTATASNIGYGWWSHDIGGHMYGTRDDELTTRWIQLGTFSPINRLHSSKNLFLSKHPWDYPERHEKVMKRYLQMRADLFPYIYTMNYRAHSEGVPMILPMYYTHPKCSAAYEVKNQYWFGSELMVAPITESADKMDMLAGVKAWLPKGIWFDYFKGTVYQSKRGRTLDVYRQLEDYPVFAKAGAIVPQCIRKAHSNEMELSEHMRVTVFPGADNVFSLYEDEGEGYNYETGGYAETELALQYTANQAIFTIDAAKGDTALLPKKRTWCIEFRGFAKEMQLHVQVGGESVECEWIYDESTATSTVIVEAEISEKITVELSAEHLMHTNTSVAERCFKVLYDSQLGYEMKYLLHGMLQDDEQSAKVKMRNVYSKIPNEIHLAKALKEQMMLDDNE